MDEVRVIYRVDKWIDVNRSKDRWTNCNRGVQRNLIPSTGELEMQKVLHQDAATISKSEMN